MLTGYTDRLSVRPGEQIRFMISTDASNFDARIVRLIHGDADPRGPGRRERPVDSVVEATYPGLKQPLTPGSYVAVPDHIDLRLRNSFTLFAWICPTRLSSEQAILSKDGPKDMGYCFGLDAGGRLFLQIGAIRIEGASALLPHRWHWVAARYDLETRAARLCAGLHPRDLSVAANRGAAGVLHPAAPSLESLLIAASMRSGRAEQFFNGLIADPTVFARCLTDAELDKLKLNSARSILPDACVAAWDFSLGIEGTWVLDVAGRALHGVTHQHPVRAMTGPHWTGKGDDPVADPRGYSAIHFHEDSLTDAGWVESFALTVPADWPSGIYAARLSAAGEADDLPFIVCPPRGRADAPLALLVPTFTYLAYGNELCGEYGLNCVYDQYVDGAGVPFASLRHPLKTFRPGRGLWKTTEGERFGRHLCAELYFVDWLEATGQTVDVITDHELHREGGPLLSAYKGVVTGSHPEYVSGRMLDALEGYLQEGGSAAYLGGNGFYSVTTLSEDGSLIEVRRPNGSRPWASRPGEGRHAMTDEMGGLWRFRGRAPQRLFGVGFAAQGWTSRGDECAPSRPYDQVADRTVPLAAALLSGIGEGERIGDFPTLGLGVGAAGDEVDRIDAALGTPAHAIVLATARGFSMHYQMVVEDRLEINDASTLPDNPSVRSDIVCFETPRGGLVFAVGSMQWFSALSHGAYSNNVAKLTHNVLMRMSR